jgi:hypothetical protein
VDLIADAFATPLTIDLAAIVSGDVDISHLVQNLDATDATDDAKFRQKTGAARLRFPQADPPFFSLPASGVPPRKSASATTALELDRHADRQTRRLGGLDDDHHAAFLALSV